jgi:hypothetical protein
LRPVGRMSPGIRTSIIPITLTEFADHGVLL